MNISLKDLTEELEEAYIELGVLQGDLPALVSLFLQHEAKENEAAAATREYYAWLDALNEAQRRRAEVLSMLKQHNDEVEAVTAQVTALQEKVETEKDRRRLEQLQRKFADTDHSEA